VVDRPVALDIRCAICGAVAIHVEMTAVGDPTVLSATPSETTGSTMPVPAGSPGVRICAGTLRFWMALETDGGRSGVRAAIEAGDVAGLLRIDEEFVPFYCRPCEASYCEEHWNTWLEFDPDDPGWLDEMRGRCPAGHERRIHD
jgi:hypothetical protein